MLRIAWYLPLTQCLGPGTRFALWVQGCRKRCAGCIAPGLQALDGGEWLSVDALAAQILAASGIEGITVSGGEPFLQAKALGRLLTKVRTARPGLGVIVYTGYTRAELHAIPDAGALLAQTDLLIDGAYEQAYDDGKGMRGSSNQQLHFLTPRYRDIRLPETRESELQFCGGVLRLIGIPSDAAKQALCVLRDRTGGTP